MPRVLESVLHWIIDHATWDASVELFKAYWGEAAAALALTTVLGIRKVLGWGKSADLPNGEIQFRYLPASPLDNGWRIAYGTPGSSARWTSATGSPSDGSISMDMDPGCAIELVLDPNASLSERLTFSVRYTSTSMFFTRVRLSSADGSQTAEKWIKYEIGSGLPHRTSGYEQGEWTLPISGTPQANGWRGLDISLRDAVQKTWGTLGWVFTGLSIVRIRGSIAISPIKLSQPAVRAKRK